VSWRGGNGGEVNCGNFRRWKSSLPPVSSLYDFSFQEHFPHYFKRNQYTFVLSLEVVGPRGSLSMLLMLCHRGEMPVGTMAALTYQLYVLRQRWHGGIGLHMALDSK
jgi:hypothetical protein